MAGGRKFPCIFEVQGRVPFPVDMLRYDSCHPVDATSCIEIEHSLDPTLSKPKGHVYTVRLRAEHLVCGPTEARWESFMWKVVDVVDAL